MCNKTVTVIMSTYNGSKYIKNQLDSLCLQKSVSIKLFVRDDGSSDNTVDIIELYRDKFELLKIVCEENIGATASFYRAAKMVDVDRNFDSDYYAFCDQDDIWLNVKLKTAIDKLQKNDSSKPILYYSNLMMMNNNNELLGMLIDNRNVPGSRYNALSAINTYGCTCVFNKIALDKFCRIQSKREFIYHDNWMYSVCSFLGMTYYDNSSYIKYRQTGSNVSGEKKTGLSLWKYRISKIFSLKQDNHLYENIAAELIDDFSDELQTYDIKLLTCIRNYRKSFRDKIYLLTTSRMKTGNVSKNVCVIGRILLNAL